MGPREGPGLCTFYNALTAGRLEKGFQGAGKDAEKPVAEVLARGGGCVEALVKDRGSTPCFRL